MEKKYNVNFKEFCFVDNEGAFYGTLVHKVYGKKNNIAAYIELDDGQKIIAVAYSDNNNYLGLPDIEIGSKVKAVFKKTKNNTLRLNEISVATL